MEVLNWKKSSSSKSARNARTAIAMLQAGASRIGTSSGVRIVEGWDEDAPIKLPKRPDSQQPSF